MGRSSWLLIGALLPVAGCGHWEGTTMPLPEVIANHGDHIRVTQREVGQIEIRQPVVVNDTLHGLRANGAPIAIPLADILRVEARTLDAGRTTWLVAAALAVAITVLIVTLIVATTSW
jgi:hypothetical protein